MSDGGDLTPLLRAMDHTWGSIIELAESLGPEEWSLPTRCPGWDVHDQIAHVASLEQLLAGGELAPDAPPAPHIRNPVGARMERGVHALRGLPPAELVDVLRTVIEVRRTALQADPPQPGDEMLGVMGNPVPVERSLPVRVLDLWAHEQDIRAATGRPGNEAGPGARVSQEAILGMLPMFWVKEAGAVAGQNLRIIVSGALSADRTVVVAADGRAAYSADPDVGEPAVTVQLDWLDLLARSHGRLGADLTPVLISGNEVMARALIAAWPMSP